MQRGLFYTTMANHRPVYTAAAAADTNSIERRNEKAFHLTTPRDSSNPNPNTNTNTNPPPVLRNILARSSQPVFSVSAMFGVRSGGGCGACGH
jgi:hypothetical protein